MHRRWTNLRRRSRWPVHPLVAALLVRQSSAAAVDTLLRVRWSAGSNPIPPGPDHTHPTRTTHVQSLNRADRVLGYDRARRASLFCCRVPTCRRETTKTLCAVPRSPATPVPTSGPGGTDFVACPPPQLGQCTRHALSTTAPPANVCACPPPLCVPKLGQHIVEVLQGRHRAPHGILRIA